MKKIMYDPSRDVAYIYLQGPGVNDGETFTTYSCDYGEVNGMINIDFDKDNKIFGIEIIPASLYLDENLLSQVRVDSLKPTGKISRSVVMVRRLAPDGE